MFNNNVSMSIVINGPNNDHIAREFISPIDRQTYVEGRQGSNFTIRLQNNNHFRVLAIPSVDGLSVMDGKPAGEHSSGYLLDGGQTLDIPGWTVDTGTVAKFFFSGTILGSDESYVGKSGQDTANKGVIGLKVFKEKITFNYNNVAVSGMCIQSNQSNFRNATPKGIYPLVGSSGDIPQWSYTASCDAGSASQASINNVVGQNLGTGFGQATDFATQKVEFKRGDLLGMMVIYYDDARQLQKRGIDVSKPVTNMRSAFPADNQGCTPPTGWQR